MADSKSTQKTNYPLPVYNFRVTIDGESLAFSEVSGLEAEYELISYRHGLSFLEGAVLETIPLTTPVSVTLKRGTSLGAKPLFLQEWMTGKKPKAVDVSLCDETGTPLISWRIAKAFAVKLSAPEFKAESNSVAIEALEVKATGISLVKN
jgi:phage tail-like protein